MTHLSFRCSGCRARIKAPIQLRGQTRPCPGCGHRLVVQSARLEDAGPALVHESFAGYRPGFSHRP
jgi:DNA-directed RNA polymerase subunit RPC12/RpoP